VSGSAYASRGASATKEDVHAAIAPYSRGLFPGAFCKITADIAGDPEYCTVMHADGAGTKSALAYIHYRETGDATVFRGIAQDSLVMNLDDMLCVGAVDEFAVSNTIGRNAHRVDGAVLKEIIAGYDRLAAALAHHGVLIELTGGETADVGDLVGTVIADATVLARLRRDAVIDCAEIRAGDVIVGLASSGQATYETHENSGIGSNGLTAARHLLLAHDYAERYPETYAATLARDQVYTGRYRLEDPLPGSAQTVGEALLSPTRTYLPVVRRVLARHGTQISGIIHSSGGGQTKCVNFGRGLHYVKDDLLPAPPIFAALAETGALAPAEMYQVFNMGQRLELYCRPEAAGGIVGIAAEFGIEGRVIGRVRAARGETGKNRLTLHTPAGALEY
jgi:phosphoribosylformylglycinamidine cyclo-ligase